MGWIEENEFEIEKREEEYPKAEYIVTASGNKVSRRSVLCGSQNIVINGKTIVKQDCMLRGDLANIKLGRYCVLHEGVLIRPPFKKFIRGCAFFPVQLGDCCVIGKETVINAATVGSFVNFGENCHIGRRCIIKDCVVIDDGAIVPDDTVMPPFTRWAGQPAKVVEELPESLAMVIGEDCREYYDKFVATGPDAPGWGTLNRKISSLRAFSRMSVRGGANPHMGLSRMSTAAGPPGSGPPGQAPSAQPSLSETAE